MLARDVGRDVGHHVGRIHARATSRVDPHFPGYYVHRSDWFFLILVEMLRHLDPGAGCFRAVSQIRQLCSGEHFSGIRIPLVSEFLWCQNVSGVRMSLVSECL
jgi:hypothetical protein